MDGDYCRVITPEMPMNDEVEEVCSMINEMMNMRAKWLFKVGGGHVCDKRQGNNEYSCIT